MHAQATPAFDILNQAGEVIGAAFKSMRGLFLHLVDGGRRIRFKLSWDVRHIGGTQQVGVIREYRGDIDATERVGLSYLTKDGELEFAVNKLGERSFFALRRRERPAPPKRASSVIRRQRQA
ncbi:MAG: hypothetical protein Q8O67_22660 [Deltaproteobacteria bacterium]|nr:hypothetical protein [Deltaproteobacteria bacterium]